MNKKFSLMYIPNAILNIALLIFLYLKGKINISICICVLIFEFVVYFGTNFFMNNLYVKNIQEFYKNNKSFTVFSGFAIFICTIEAFTDISFIIAIIFLKSVLIANLIWFHHAKTDKVHYHESELEKRNKKLL